LNKINKKVIKDKFALAKKIREIHPDSIGFSCSDKYFEDEKKGACWAIFENKNRGPLRDPYNIKTFYWDYFTAQKPPMD